MKKHWTYLGVFLDSESRDRLLSEVCHHIPDSSWRTIAEHMTVVFNRGGEYWDNIMEQYRHRFGDTVKLKVKQIGISDEAVAVQVCDPTASVVSTNLIEHITVAVAPGCKPVRSNYIENWKDIDNFYVSGTLKLV